MPSNFKRPQLQQASLGRAQVANTPTRDNAAHQRAAQISKNIDSLNNIATNVVSAVSKSEQAYKTNEARRATADMPDYIDRNVRTMAQEDGHEFRDLTSEQLDLYSRRATGQFYEERGINDSPYAQQAHRIGEDLSNRTYGSLIANSKKDRDVYNSNLITERTGFQASTVTKGQMSGASFIETLGNDLVIDANAMGPVTESQTSAIALGNVNRAKQAQFEGIMSSMTTDGSPELVEMLKTDEAKKYFSNIENYNKMVKIGENKSISTINSKSQQNFRNIENIGYNIADSGGFTSKTDVDSFISEQLKASKGSVYAPKSKAIFNLRQKLYKTAGENHALEGYRRAIDNGDNTWLKSQGFKAEEEEAIITKKATQDIGVTDFSPESINSILSNDSQKSAFVSYVRSGQPIPEQMKLWAKERPVNGFEGYKQKYTQYQEINALTEGRINDIFDKKSQNEMLFMGNLLSRDVEENVKQETFAKFQNDINKNVDSFGNYYSPEASQVLKDEAIRKDIEDFSKNAPWAMSELSSPVYVNRQVKSNMAMYMASGHTPEESLNKAKQVFERTHDYVEMPNGEEGIITPEFKSVQANVKDMTKFVMHNKNVKRYIETTNIAGEISGQGFLADILTSEVDPTEDISFRPVPQYEKTKEYQVFFRGELVPNTRFTPRQYQNGISQINAFERAEIEANRKRNNGRGPSSVLSDEYKYRPINRISIMSGVEPWSDVKGVNPHPRLKERHEDIALSRRRGDIDHYDPEVRGYKRPYREVISQQQLRMEERLREAGLLEEYVSLQKKLFKFRDKQKDQHTYRTELK